MSSDLLKEVRYGRVDTDMQIGEGFAGDGVNAAHINTVLGPKDGPVGTAWATALATPPRRPRAVRRRRCGRTFR